MLRRIAHADCRKAGRARSTRPGDGKVTLGDVLRRNWFELWYQPKIDLRPKRLVGAEGLVRARRPDGSLIAPALFLPGANEDDMLALTERVILTALRDFEDCAEHGASVKLSVNVPVSAFVKLPIAQMLREERPARRPGPGSFSKSPRTRRCNDLKIANEVADELRALNCSLALDDFGAGYSSLARLRQLPFSELKIDRSYVTDCHLDHVNAGLCETIVELAKRFELKTVAEGIETMHESHKLQGIGCDIGQGYLFAKPMPKAAVRRRARPAHGRRPEAGRKAASAPANCCVACSPRRNARFSFVMPGLSRPSASFIPSCRGSGCPQHVRNDGRKRMPAYWVARSKINDPVEYKKYTDRVPAIIAKYGGKVLGARRPLPDHGRAAQISALRGDRISDFRAGRRLLHPEGIRRGGRLPPRQRRRRGRDHHGRWRRRDEISGEVE